MGEDRTVANENPACIGETVVLDAEVNGAIDYKWYRDGTELTAWAGNTELEVTESGTYSVELFFSATCMSTDSLEMEFIAPPIIAGPPLDLAACDNDGNGSEVFDLSENADRILGGQDPSIYQVRFYGSMADAMAFRRPISNTTEYISVPSTIYARISSNRSCYEIASFELTIRERNSTVSFQEEYILCLDSIGGVLGNPPALDTGLSAMDFIFEWYRDSIVPENLISGANTSFYLPDAPGTYHVTWQDPQWDCVFSANAIVRASQEPEEVDILFLTEIFSENNTIEIEVQGNGTYIYSLDDGPFGTSNRFEDLGIGEHTAAVRDVEGCSTIFKDFLVVDYPRFFTPNGDNVNDEWAIVGMEEIQNAQVSIFDRYGSLLYFFDAGGAWDGTINGSPAPSSDYWFRITYNRDDSPRQFMSHFSLKR